MALQQHHDDPERSRIAPATFPAKPFYCLAAAKALVLLASIPFSGFCYQSSQQRCEPVELRVFVKDSQESPVFEAAVKVASGSQTAGEEATPTSGLADFANVSCGTWTVTASKQGFEQAIQTVEITGKAVAETTIILQPKAQISSVEVKETAPPVEQSSSANNELRPSNVKPLPTNPASVTDVLPLVPGVVRSPDGELSLQGSGEQRSALVVNQSDVTDPATGKFGQTVPVDSIETVNVLATPFLAQYGRFTQAVVAVETRRGGEKWHGDLNDPFPDFRIRSFHLRGIRNETPRGVLGGPVIKQRLYFISSLQYLLDKVQSRTLGFPYNESKQERWNSFTQIDYIASPKQIVNATLHVTPQHINFVNPDYFSPQPVTPTYAQHNYIGTVADHYGLWGGTLDSSLSIQRFSAYIGSQGPADMVLRPTGNQGNYFGNQAREAKRTEWLEIWSPAPVRAVGTHLFKVGDSFTKSSNEGQYSYHPVDILDAAGNRVQRIDFTAPAPFNRTDLEVNAYVQDHWSVTPKIAFDLGGRVEHQQIASSLRVAPRAGIAWTPFKNERTVFRAGYGSFYDHIPLDVYTFGRYPQRTVSNYAPDGSLVGSPIQYVNTIGSANGPRSFLVRGEIVAGDFSPRGQTWNLQAEHSFSPLLRFRAVYMNNRSTGLVVVEPDLFGRTNEIVLSGNGRSRYRQLELTAKTTWKKGQELNFAYTHSRSQGTLNEFDSFVGNFPIPIIRPEAYTNLPGNLPNRFLAWGHVTPHIWSLEVYPIVEYRNGFQYTRLDAFQNYFGVPYGDSDRFPNFFSADARLMRDFALNPKYTVRLSVTGFNLTNHFNALAVHSNVADPQSGVFFGNYHRRYRFDFEVVY